MGVGGRELASVELRILTEFTLTRPIVLVVPARRLTPLTCPAWQCGMV